MLGSYSFIPMKEMRDRNSTNPTFQSSNLEYQGK